ncbi:hypothetical protein KKB40_00410 [Patescibacteria group bacterium]|nr:hypothetical protein [Patescibacteria group bacterium]
MTMALPEPLYLVVGIIQKKIEISPEADEVLTISLWDFRDESGDLIPKDDLKQILRLLQERKVLQIVDVSCLSKLGRFAGEGVKIKIDREKLLTVNDEAQVNKAEGVFTWRELKLDLPKGTLQYKNNNQVEISPTQDEIKFLVLLMESYQIVTYGKIADKLDLNCRASSHPAEVAKAVQYLRRNVVPILEKAGMTRSEIEDMILSKRNAGYKLFRP